MKTQTLEQIQNLIVAKLGVKAEALVVDKPMKEFGLDSLSQIELLFMIEEHFQISVPDAQTKVTTLQDLADVIDLLLKEKVSAKTS